MFEKIREDGSKRLRMDAYPTLFAHSAPSKRRKPPADRSVALQSSLASSLGDHSYASADVSHAPMAITADDHDYQNVCAGIFLVSLQVTKCGVVLLTLRFFPVSKPYCVADWGLCLCCV